MRALFLKSLVVFSLLTCPVITIYAAPVTYDETISGDISFSDFIFDSGINTVSGTTSTALYTSDEDYFSFLIPVGTELVSMLYSFSNVTLEPGATATGLWFDGVTTYWSDQLIDVTAATSPVVVAEVDLPVGTGLYYWNPSHATAGLEGLGGSWDYRIDFTVTPVSSVPLPPAVWLFGSGVLGLIGMAKRKKASL